MLMNTTTIGAETLQEGHRRGLRWMDAAAATTGLVLTPLLGAAFALLLAALLLVAGRALVRRAPISSPPAGAVLPRALMVGDLPGVLDLLADLRERPPADVEPVAVYVPAATGALLTGSESAPAPRHAIPGGEDARVEGILDASIQHRVEIVVLTTTAPLSAEEIRHLRRRLSDADVLLSFTEPAEHGVPHVPTRECH